MTIVEFFREVPEAVVAFSGGVDSAALLALAARHARRTKAYFVRTPFQPAFELQDAEDTARRLGAELQVIDYDILAVPAVAGNPPDRCYHCKRSLFTALLAAAKADGFSVVLDGSNASDDAGDRPGMRALRELEVRSPLRECGLTKSDVRRLAREAGLPVCILCLPGHPGPHRQTAITRWRTTGAGGSGESRPWPQWVFHDFRLRLRGDGALLQVREDQWEEARRRLEELRSLLAGDFTQVELDAAPRQTRES